MNYSFEQRDDEVYLLTNEKHNDKNIVIKMDSVIREDFVTNYNKDNLNVKWKLINKEDDLYLTAEIENIVFEQKLDMLTIVNELTSIVKEDKALTSCENLLKNINSLFNEIFLEYTKKGHLIFSDNIINGLVEVQCENKILGYATRFILSSENKIYLCEYSGKTIKKDMDVVFNVKIKEDICKYNVSSFDTDADEVFLSTQLIGYFGATIELLRISTYVDDIENVPSLKVLNYLANKNEMYRYCIDNNSFDDIKRYQKSLKPKIKLINVNNFMLREFTV